VADIQIARQIAFPPGTVVVDDRAYNDYRLFAQWISQGIYFVTKMKDNALYEVVGEREVPQNRNILTDELIQLTGYGARDKCPHPLRRIEVYDPKTKEVHTFLTNHMDWGPTTIAAIYKDRWQIGVSRKGRITQPVEVRPRLKDPRPRSLEGAGERKRYGGALRQHSWKGGWATFQVVTCSERRGSLVTRYPVAETVDNARRQQGPVVKGHRPWLSPAGYQRRHGTKGNAETGEALGTHRRKLGEEARPITVSGKWLGWYQGGGSGCSTVDPRAAKHAGREGPEPAGIPFGKGRQG